MISFSIDIKEWVTWCLTNYPTETAFCVLAVVLTCLVTFFIGYRFGRSEKNTDFAELERLARIRQENNSELATDIQKLRELKSSLEKAIDSSNKKTEILKIEARIAALSILMIGTDISIVGIFKSSLILYTFDCLRTNQSPVLNIANFLEKSSMFDDCLRNVMTSVKAILLSNEEYLNTFTEISKIYESNEKEIKKITDDCSNLTGEILNSAREMGFYRN